MAEIPRLAGKKFMFAKWLARTVSKPTTWNCNGLKVKIFCKINVIITDWKYCYRVSAMYCDVLLLGRSDKFWSALLSLELLIDWLIDFWLSHFNRCILVFPVIQICRRAGLDFLRYLRIPDAPTLFPSPQPSPQTRAYSPVDFDKLLVAVEKRYGAS